MKSYNKLIDSWLKRFLKSAEYSISKGRTFDKEVYNKTIANVESYLENVNINNIIKIMPCNSLERIREGLEDELLIIFKNEFEVIIWSGSEYSLKNVNSDCTITIDFWNKEDLKILKEILQKSRIQFEKENPWYVHLPWWLKKIKENNKYLK